MDQNVRTSRGHNARHANLLGALALRIVDQLRDALVDDGGRGFSATAALIHLRLRPGQNIDFLARLLEISHPATVRLVDRLEAAGLVERRASRDPRARALVLTRAGQRAAVAALSKRLDVLLDILGPLTASERRQLEPLLEKLLATLTGDRRSARHGCRLCDFATCDDPACPVDRALAEPGVPVRRVTPVI
jgi:MarR family transcriptional regulator, negative regulator of the multidrug operon emrRAB